MLGFRALLVAGFGRLVFCARAAFIGGCEAIEGFRKSPDVLSFLSAALPCFPVPHVKKNQSPKP